MTRAIQHGRTHPLPDSSAGPTASRPRPQGSSSARRVRNFFDNLRLSASPALAWNALRHHCQQPVLGFLRSGGRIGDESVEYRGVVVDRAPFRGRDLAGVAYLQRFVDFGGRIDRRDGRFVATLPNGLRFEAGDSMLVDTLLMIDERFVDDEYAWITPRHRVVIDVGASIGDSVLYFASKGAEFVYGYEPQAAAYDAAQRNLAINHVDNAVVERAAVTPDGGEGVAFHDVLRRAAAEHPDAEISCKIDCEGCEYEILAPDALDFAEMDHVAEVMVEYHAEAPPADALEKLGFDVETEPRGPDGVGWMRARRAA